MELRKDDFKTWLKKNPNIGFLANGYSTSCPIATWIKAVTGYKFVSVSPFDWCHNVEGKSMTDFKLSESFSLPTWAKEFIRETNRKNTSVSADALRNLANVRSV